METFVAFSFLRISSFLAANSPHEAIVDIFPFLASKLRDLLGVFVFQLKQDPSFYSYEILTRERVFNSAETVINRFGAHAEIRPHNNQVLVISLKDQGSL